MSCKCPNCKSHNFKEYEDETICMDCGLVLSSTITYVAGIHINLPWGIRLK